MTPPSPRIHSQRIAQMTDDEAAMIDAYLATGSFTDAANLCNKHRNTVRRVYFRYQSAIRDAIQAARAKSFSA